MQQEVSRLVSEGRTEEALLLLLKYNSDAVLLQARYKQAKKQQNMGMLDFSEWSKVQAQVNYAALEMARLIDIKNVVVVAPTVVYNFFNFERQPGNDLGTVNKVYDAFNKMERDLDYPQHEIEKGVNILHEIFSLPELVDKVEDFQKSQYKDNTEAYKLQKRKEFVALALTLENDLKLEIKQAVEKEQKETNWREAFALVVAEPTKVRWDNTCNLISNRLKDPIFTTTQQDTWDRLVDRVSEVPEGLLWTRKFKSLLPDIQSFIHTNVR